MYADQVLSANTSATLAHTATIGFAVGDRVSSWVGSSSLSLNVTTQNSTSYGFTSANAVVRGEEAINFAVYSPTRMTGSVSALAAAGSANPRTGWVLRDNGNNVSMIELLIPGDGAPQEFDLVLPAGQYRLSMNVVGVGEVSRYCGCSEFSGTANVAWDVQFQRP